RPLRRDDDLAVDTVFAGLSAQSRYLRFHSPTPVLSAGTRRRLLDVDGRTHAALLAELPTVAGWHPVGIARLIAHAPRQAELAVAVVDDRQGRGIGRRLVEGLGTLAAELGYAELFGDVLRENVRIVRLLRSAFPGARLTWNDGTLRVSCRIDRPTGEITDEDILADLLF
ncbi:GNAT family N-acetyltransferase, partial [Pseudonocardia abyssalis]